MSTSDKFNEGTMPKWKLRLIKFIALTVFFILINSAQGEQLQWDLGDDKQMFNLINQGYEIKAAVVIDHTRAIKHVYLQRGKSVYICIDYLTNSDVMVLSCAALRMGK